jgi:hypothetical protein
VGQTLSFASLFAIFARRFQAVWPCPFQLRFKQPEAAAFFREALRRNRTGLGVVRGRADRGLVSAWHDATQAGGRSGSRSSSGRGPRSGSRKPTA